MNGCLLFEVAIVLSRWRSLATSKDELIFDFALCCTSATLFPLVLDETKLNYEPFNWP